MLYYPVYALNHYYPETARFRFLLTFVLLAAGVWLAVMLYRSGKISLRTTACAIALWAYLLFLLYITLIGRYTLDDYRTRLTPFDSYREYASTGSAGELRGIVLNILMFLPFGFLTASCFRDKKPLLISLSAGLMLPVLIEGLQYLTRTGTLETDDVIHNAIGTLLGSMLWLAMNQLVLKRHRR